MPSHKYPMEDPKLDICFNEEKGGFVIMDSFHCPAMHSDEVEDGEIVGDQGIIGWVNSSPLLSHVKERIILTEGEGREIDMEEGKGTCCLVEGENEMIKDLSKNSEDVLSHGIARQDTVLVGDMTLNPNLDFGAEALGSRKEVRSPQQNVMLALGRLEEDELVEDKDRKELEVNCIINYLCDSVTEDILENLLDEIVDTEEVDLQKRLLMKEITNSIHPLKVMEMEALIVELNDKENGETFDALGIEQWDGKKATPDCAKYGKKRDRKSLSELRANDGEVEG
ncbi:hypothetical protein SUGI_1198690 [Cryptomeria japonica]|nr:hypothetical protein SUGI_1198690 [Cryptomeria japonica]